MNYLLIVLYSGCLYFSSEGRDVWGASAWCQNNGGYLVEILNESQMDFLIMQLNFVEVYEGSKLWWTGGSDNNREGNWYWQHTLQDVENFVWDEGRPGQDTFDNYLLLSWDRGYMGFDSNGAVKACHYICQQDV